MAARVGAPYAVQGWSRVQPLVDSLRLLTEPDWLWYRLGNCAWRTVDVGETRIQGGLLLMRFANCSNRDGAAQYRGAELAIERAELPKLPEGDYYWSDLVGLRVIACSGVEFGNVARLLETGANDVLVVAPTPDSLDQRERLIPYVPERTILEVDIPAGFVRVDWDADY